MILIATSLCVEICRANLTFAKFPFPMVFNNLYFPICSICRLAFVLFTAGYLADVVAVGVGLVLVHIRFRSEDVVELVLEWLLISTCSLLVVSATVLLFVEIVPPFVVIFLFQCII